MMKLKVEIEGYNLKWIENEADHIAVSISQGKTEGEGWSITGTKEPEPAPEVVEEELLEEELI
jgi:hypothetical protein